MHGESCSLVSQNEISSRSICPEKYAFTSLMARSSFSKYFAVKCCCSLLIVSVTRFGQFWALFYPPMFYTIGKKTWLIARYRRTCPSYSLLNLGPHNFSFAVLRLHFRKGVLSYLLIYFKNTDSILCKILFNYFILI